MFAPGFPGRGRRALLATAAALAGAMLAANAVPPLAGPAAASVEAPAPLGRWSAEAGRALIAEIGTAAGEGLDPAYYQRDALTAELQQTGGGAAFDRMANAAALKLAHDYLLGAVEEKSAYDWHIDRDDGDPARLAAALQQAVAAGKLRPWLRSLLPRDGRYAALRTAYAETPDGNFILRGRLRANLERWRWMPRDLGVDHIYVNVPSYTLQVVAHGRTIAEHVVVVGAKATPTPAISYPAEAVVLNPWWTPPKSIKVSGKGFVRDGGAWRQPPGPRNALGRVKIDLPNPHAIYLHDTPAKAYFEKPSRAYSHGCIRVQNAERLAAELVSLDSGDAGAVAQGLKSYRTQTLKLRQPRPVWLVYFTVDVAPDGKLELLEDPYNRDTKLIAQLDKPVRLAMR